ncbi:hypothetical protein AVEN_249191-1 [Araneus ventricosus]|uniref:Uncharacterized protein n=1 Tax=Araneus ventricosus TaxID=182803 RepID=A0A4Y2HXE3_ARAVE|nr:hypothetical protein AVEN_249191-1 [Araneus ventricosus]
MDYIYPDKPFQNTINVLAASILNENLLSSDIETRLLASESRLLQVQSWREIGVLFSTERDPNRLEKRVRESLLSLTGGKSDISHPNREYQNRPVIVYYASTTAVRFENVPCLLYGSESRDCLLMILLE